MRRKQKAAIASGSPAPGDPPPSPASTGAMDNLLEKLRAAAPQTRDTRDRRRRARLKDRHQVRVASGQKIPETGENLDENGLLSPTKTEGSEEGGASTEGGTSEGEDIADRAASLLQGLRGDGEGEGPSRDESLRVRRRRESADDERARRRERRRRGGTSTDTTARESTITEEADNEHEKEDADKRSSGSSDPQQLPTPTIVIEDEEED